MADFYMDTDAGSDASNGTTWALAKLTLEGLLGVMSAGDRGFIQGATTDTSAVSRTFTSPGTVISPCIITGVADGTTNEPPVEADLAVTLPTIGTTASGYINLVGVARYNNIDLDTTYRIQGTVEGVGIEFVNCRIAWGSRWTTDYKITLINTDIDTTSTLRGNGYFTMYGGTYDANNSTHVLEDASNNLSTFIGVNFINVADSIADSPNGQSLKAKLINCSLPANTAGFSGNANWPGAYIEMIGCSSDTSKPDSDSFQDYFYEDAHGIVELETTVLRTNGATDNASGSFSYSMTPKADATLEGSTAYLSSPVMSTWVPAGSQTLTVYICNDGGVDYNEDEVWLQVISPGEGDTAQYDISHSPLLDATKFPSSTAITDDLGSTWGGTGSNAQKIEITKDPGYEGVVSARLHVAKKQATPDTVYLDPKIYIT